MPRAAAAPPAVAHHLPQITKGSSYPLAMGEAPVLGPALAPTRALARAREFGPFTVLREPCPAYPSLGREKGEGTLGIVRSKFRGMFRFKAGLWLLLSGQHVRNKSCICCQCP